MTATTLIARKFSDPDTTAKGETRARVAFGGMKTLWLNTGTLCNIECANCYIESSPGNDRLVYLTLTDVLPYLDELDAAGEAAIEIGITGGEPFMAPEIIAIMEACLSRGHDLLILTNAMQPMMRPRVQAGLLDLQARFGARLTLRVSLDHYTQLLHDQERGEGSFEITMAGLKWLARYGFRVALAGRTLWGEEEAAARAGFGELIIRTGLDIDPEDPAALVLFPEMQPEADPPEITTACWGILDKDPAELMCASQRMVVKRKGAASPSVLACTLIPYDPRFDLGTTLAEARAEVALNHPYCASFCVLGGGSCSA
ncbi:MAG: radical SAM protein [Hyphomonadaceae bacterium]|nr:radical SAM protein [Hyphomonadaceae bacterium]